ncbi:MAG: hypothetical protein ACKODB_12325, partial [Betaproteobacteria bacterium]
HQSLGSQPEPLRNLTDPVNPEVDRPGVQRLDTREPLGKRLIGGVGAQESASLGWRSISARR